MLMGCSLGGRQARTSGAMAGSLCRERQPISLNRTDGGATIRFGGLSGHMQGESAFGQEAIQRGADAAHVDADPPTGAVSGNAIEMIAGMVLAVTGARRSRWHANHRRATTGRRKFGESGAVRMTMQDELRA